MSSFDFGSISAYKFGAYTEVSANTNASTVAMDTQGFEGVALMTAVGTGNLNSATSLTISAVLLEGDDTNISNATAIAASKIVANPTLATSNIAYWASVKTSKRYLFATYVPTTNAAANIASVAALGFPHDAPTQ